MAVADLCPHLESFTCRSPSITPNSEQHGFLRNKALGLFFVLCKRLMYLNIVGESFIRGRNSFVVVR
jgi:hypothetical protein